MESIDIRLPSTRVGYYQKTLDKLIKIYKNKDEKAASTEFAYLVGALYEAHELILIHEGLCNLDDTKYLYSKLSHLVKGPASRADEDPATSSNRARNTAFELMLAGRLREAGLKLRTDIGTDTACDIDARTLIFECKRPLSEKALESNVHSAARQLRKKYQRRRGSKYRGIVAIDITKIICPKAEILIPESLNHVGIQLENLLADFFDRHSSAWRRVSHKKSIAILLRASLTASSQNSEEGIAYCQQYLIAPLAQKGTINYTTAELLGGAFTKLIADRALGTNSE